LQDPHDAAVQPVMIFRRQILRRDDDDRRAAPCRIRVQGAHELKAEPELASIPVIMITIVDNEALCLDRGASNYLLKPIDRDRLAVALEQYRSQPARQEVDSELTHSRKV